MRSNQSNRLCAAGAFLVLSLFCGGALGPSQSMAAGALAIGLPPDVAKGGFTYGYSNNNADANHAEFKALDACRSTKDAVKDTNLRSLCKVIEDTATSASRSPWIRRPERRGSAGRWRMI